MTFRGGDVIVDSSKANSINAMERWKGRIELIISYRLALCGCVACHHVYRVLYPFFFPSDRVNCVSRRKRNRASPRIVDTLFARLAAH